MGVFTVGRQVGLEILMPGWWLSGASIDLDFRNSRYYDSSVPNTVSLPTDFLSCVRASDGYARNSSGTWISFASNQLRITDLGFLVEDSATNNLVNSGSPATQTTASLATGNYTLWVEGSGSALASAGSATITGAASATENNPDTFAVTVAGTVTVTVTGSLTRFQLESGVFASSFISTAGAAATRAADAITTSGTLDTLLTATPGTALIDHITNTNPANLAGGGGNVGVLYDNGTNTGLLITGSSNTVALVFDTSANHSLNFTLGGASTFSGGVKAGFSWDGSGRSGVGGGGTVATDAFGSMGSATYKIGIQVSNFVTFAYFRRLTIWNSRLADATLQALTV